MQSMTCSSYTVIAGSVSIDFKMKFQQFLENLYLATPQLTEFANILEYKTLHFSDFRKWNFGNLFKRSYDDKRAFV